jgi:Geranylgeranyl pyrophosphate synthase
MNKFYEKYISYKTRIDERLFNFIEKEHPKSLYEPLKYILSGGGKRIRPMLVLFCCEAVGGKFEDALDASIAMEILHNFTLVHDDIMDNADTRRGMETIHKKWDTSIAILAGDELIGLAYKSLLNTPAGDIREISKSFTDGIIEVCEGQSFDKEFEERRDVRLDEYLMMIEKKTSMLLVTCAEIGALIGNAPSETINSLKKYAGSIGLAFQIQDDMLDITADEKEFGKKIGGDLVEGKKTYLLLKAMELVNKPEDKAKIDFIIGNNGLKTRDEEAIGEIKRIYEEYGVIKDAHEAVEKYTTLAENYLNVLKNSEAKEMLVWFSRMLLGRSY